MYAMDDVINRFKNMTIQKSTDCYQDKVLQKNPLDDFVIIIILECIYEFYEMRWVSKEFQEIYPFDIDKVKIISDDRFKDWNIEGIITAYKQEGSLVKRIFDYDFESPFHLLDFQKKNDFYKNMQALNNTTGAKITITTTY